MTDQMRWKDVDEIESEMDLLTQITDHVLCNPEDGPWEEEEKLGLPFDPKTEYCTGVQHNGKKLFMVIVHGTLEDLKTSASIETYPNLSVEDSMYVARAKDRLSAFIDRSLISVYPVEKVLQES